MNQNDKNEWAKNVCDAFYQFGASMEMMGNALSELSKTYKLIIESYLTAEEIAELNDSKTKNKRKKQLIDISTSRMMLESLNKK